MSAPALICSIKRCKRVVRGWYPKDWLTCCCEHHQPSRRVRSHHSVRHVFAYDLAKGKEYWNAD